MLILLGFKSNDFNSFLIKKENSNKTKFKINLNHVKNVKKEVLVIYGTTNVTTNNKYYRLKIIIN